MSDVLLTGEQWQTIFDDVIVHDPDGWRGDSAPIWNVSKMTKAQYFHARDMSTCDYTNWKEGRLQAQLDAANELIEELGDALEDLLDHQNGCPLPKYEIPWNRAVESSRIALNKWRALKLHDDGEVTG